MPRATATRRCARRWSGSSRRTKVPTPGSSSPRRCRRARETTTRSPSAACCRSSPPRTTRPRRAAQPWRESGWILLANGSRTPETRDALTVIAADPRVTLLRVDANVGILGGMRRVLEHATGRYVLPVDSDDYVFPDALAIVAAV